MRWRAVAAGMALAGGIAVEGWAPAASDAQQNAGGGAWVAAQGAGAPDPVGTIVLPPHLAGGFPRPVAMGANATLPTLQDMLLVSPTYAAPPPARPKRRQKSGGDH